MKNKKKKSLFLIIVLILFSLFCFVFGFLFFKKSIVSIENDLILYNEKSDVSYKVYLKENKFFEEKYLGMNQVYITSLIDYLDIDFNYDLVFNEIQSGNYSYYVSGVMSADTTNTNGNYWKKEYRLSDVEKEDFSNLNVVNIIKNVKIDYQKYNDFLMEFKKEYSLAVDASLKVYLNIEVNVKNDLSDDVVTKNSVCSLSIPLTKSTIEVPISINNVNFAGALISSVDEKLEHSSIVNRYIGIGLFVTGLVLVAYLTIYFVRHEETKYYYDKKIKKILKTYDAIIVNVEKLPSNVGLKVIPVNSFEELLDAHSEVRMPINFYEDGSEATFTLINDAIMWIYVLKKGDVK